jgi:ATP-dependent Lhr-like helicase
LIWITPLRALSKETEYSLKRANASMGLDYTVALRTGDTSNSEKAKQLKNPPDILIITPESLHLLFTQKGNGKLFENVKYVICDEWHELIGNKRGVLTELAISRLQAINPKLLIWGISATIGNLDQALEVLCGGYSKKTKIIRSNHKKTYQIDTILPEKIELLPWAGHLGIKLLKAVLPIIEKSKTVLIFTNTRSQSEIWYQKILEMAPELAGNIALHHSSISSEIRIWVENALKTGQIKVVVATSSLDLGVDFHPVDTIIQIGSPKGVARFMQRAGRSGHQPGATAKIYFLPTHSLEIAEAAALRKAIEIEHIESKIPLEKCFDVLAQYLITLSVGDGLSLEDAYGQVKNTFCFRNLLFEEFDQLSRFLISGGSTLQAYDEYNKLTKSESGYYFIANKRLALRHKLSIGTIPNDQMMVVKYVGGKKLGAVEEWFVTKLKPGDTFFFGGRNVEVVRIRDAEVQVKSSSKKTGIVPAWMGGRMPLSSNLSEMLKITIEEAIQKQPLSKELKFLQPLFDLQAKKSIIPQKDALLIEKLKSREGYHLFFYPFEGRMVNEVLASLLAYRLSKQKPLSISIAMNDYGFELLCDQPIPIEEALEENLLGTENLYDDILKSINATELAARKFRDIAQIAGLTFSGFPGRMKKTRHLQASGKLIFDVFEEHDPKNLLLRQAYEEALFYGIEEQRLFKYLKSIDYSKLTIKEIEKPTPFCFPIMVDRLRDSLSSESLESRVEKMIEAALKG